MMTISAVIEGIEKPCVGLSPAQQTNRARPIRGPQNLSDLTGVLPRLPTVALADRRVLELFLAISVL
ncbi:MAG TPA: hypothetical protein VGN12_08740 [Pirellulales bacterium]|jgi:hypothetical protein